MYEVIHCMMVRVTRSNAVTGDRFCQEAIEENFFSFNNLAGRFFFYLRCKLARHLVEYAMSYKHWAIAYAQVSDNQMLNFKKVNDRDDNLGKRYYS